MQMAVTVTVRWDDTQFAVIAAFLGGSDRAEMQVLTAQLKASGSSLADAVAHNANAPQP